MMRRLGVVLPAAISLAALALTLHGCGDSHTGPAPSPPPPPGPPAPESPTPVPTPVPTPQPTPVPTPQPTHPTPAPPGPQPGPPPPAGDVLKAFCYGALPCRKAEVPYGQSMATCGAPAEDMMQQGYAMQWGPDGRDDLGTMKAMGANAVRLYHSMGVGEQMGGDHSAFLDRAQELGLKVLPGIHTYLPCKEFDCYEPWKTAVKAFFAAGGKKDSAWHPAVSTVILMNEPDFFGTGPDCTPKNTSETLQDSKSWCRVKMALSALEGLLDAEKESNVAPGEVQLTITWSFGMYTSIDGKVSGPGVYGFQDMVAGTANPQIADYTPRTSAKELKDAFDARWIHGMNTQAPFGYVRDLIGKEYAQFLPHKWFIGEYGANGQTQSVIASDLQAAEDYSATNPEFWGMGFFQFQVAYSKGGPEMNFGVFSVGSTQIGTTGQVCEDSTCSTWPVYCLETELAWFDKTPDLNHRAEAVAKGWGGKVQSKGICKTKSSRMEVNV